MIVERISDLYKEAEIYVLSRELAKLDHGVEGIGAARRSGARNRCHAIRKWLAGIGATRFANGWQTLSYGTSPAERCQILSTSAGPIGR